MAFAVISTAHAADNNFYNLDWLFREENFNPRSFASDQQRNCSIRLRAVADSYFCEPKIQHVSPTTKCLKSISTPNTAAPGFLSRPCRRSSSSAMRSSNKCQDRNRASREPLLTSSNFFHHKHSLSSHASQTRSDAGYQGTAISYAT